ncbi:hypothetical protein AB4559_20120 [Vibrio sp. 10N.222.51.C8]|uniref:hypothetical protein n=1 Tax=unclassified Vibrio TaxID=2614977 RepID=UPI0010BD1F84|nr:hypothetical protein [Vibrio sp. F12]TKE94358.1 hypothetical protein FCV53_02560 [Vibrio sp. F12]USN27402.1 hypothetical protein [synthetic construct]
MRKQYRIDNNIYQYISQPEVTDFTVVGVRDWVLECSSMYGNKNNARLFVARQLDALEKAGLIVCKGAGRKKAFFRSERFFEAKFKSIAKQKRNKKINESPFPQQTSIFIELQNEKASIEAELAITLAEVDEYKVLMARSSDLNKLLKKSYLEATQKAAALMAKLNVWTRTMKLIRLDESTLC